MDNLGWMEMAAATYRYPMSITAMPRGPQVVKKEMSGSVMEDLCCIYAKAVRRGRLPLGRYGYRTPLDFRLLPRESSPHRLASGSVWGPSEPCGSPKRPRQPLSLCRLGTERKSGVVRSAAQGIVESWDGVREREAGRIPMAASIQRHGNIPMAGKFWKLLLHRAFKSRLGKVWEKVLQGAALH